jgi:hypothetical protein
MDSITSVSGKKELRFTFRDSLVTKEPAFMAERKK